MKFIGYFLAAVVILSPASLYAATGDPEAEYQEAAKCFHDVKALPVARQSRAKWHSCVQLLDAVAVKYPDGKRAPDAIFSAGLAYRNLYESTANEEDANASVKKFDDLVRRYPKDRLADDALFNIATLQQEALKDTDSSTKTFYRLIKWYPDGDMAGRAEEYLDSLGAEKSPDLVRKTRQTKPNAVLESILRQKNDDDDGEKLIFKLRGKADFTEENGTLENPKLSRYTLQLKNTHLSHMLSSGDYSFVGKGVVRDISWKQTENSEAVIDIVIKAGHRCAASGGDAGLVVMCGKIKPRNEVAAAPKKTPEKLPAPPGDAKAASAGKGNPPAAAPAGKPLVVVIDPGHGGKDSGAIGPSGVKEKDIALLIAKRLGWQLRNKLGMEVNYTRIEDRFVSLSDRNSIARGYNADLFISVHANASEDGGLAGYQTFFLNNATDAASRELAARENATLGKSIDDVENIILTMMQNANTDESRILAGGIHKKVLSGMSKYALKDRKVKSALFYVLVGARCPAILIETSFISNGEEEKKLGSPDYQEMLARSISDGVRDYLTKGKMLKTDL